MAAFSDDFSYTGSLFSNGWTELSHVSAGDMHADGSTASVNAAAGWACYAIQELVSNAHYVEVDIGGLLSPVGAGRLPTLIVANPNTYVFPTPYGYAFEMTFAGVWFYRIWRDGVIAVDYTGFAPDFPARFRLEHDGAGEVTVYRDSVQIASYTDGTPLTGLWAGFGAAADGMATFDNADGADVGGAADVTGTATATLGGLAAVAVGVREGVGVAAANFGALKAAATGTRTVHGLAVASLGGLSATATDDHRAVSSVFRVWRVRADDRVLAPIHDRRITVPPSARLTIGDIP